MSESLKLDNAAARLRMLKLALGFTALYAVSAIPLAMFGGVEPRWVAASVGLAVMLILLSVIDVESFRLPDELTLPLLAAGLMRAGIIESGFPLWHTASAVLGGLALYGVGFIYRRMRGRDGLGLGDVKLFAAAGAWVGCEGLASVLLIACAAAIIGIFAARLRGTKFEAQSAIPFGPCIAFGFWIVWLYGALA